MLEYRLFSFTIAKIDYIEENDLKTLGTIISYYKIQ